MLKIQWRGKRECYDTHVTRVWFSGSRNQIIHYDLPRIDGGMSHTLEAKTKEVLAVYTADSVRMIGS